MPNNPQQFSENGIYHRHWPVTKGETKAAVLLVHGLGEHCERYTALAEAFNEAGYAVASIDLPGHGQSSGQRGHIDNFADFEKAALALYTQIQQWHPDKPIYLLGHSMGGLISAHMLIEHQNLFQGALLSGAAIQSPQQPPAWQIGIMKLVAKVAPKAGMLLLDASAVSRDPAVVETYMNDPLVNKGKLSAKLLVEMFGTMADTKQHADAIKLPIRIMHGSADVMTAAAGSEWLYQHVASADKELKIYEGLYHEIFNEPEQLEIYQEMVAWLDARTV